MIVRTRIFLTAAAFLFFFLCSFFPAYGSDDIVVRLSASPESPVVGQKVVLKLDVLAKDGWVQVKSFRRIELDGGFVKRYESQGTRLNERIDGAEYSGQRYEIFLFGFYPGDLQLESQPLDVEIKTWGAQGGSEMRQVMTPPVDILVQKPDDLPEGRSVVSSSNFKAGQTWSPETSSLKVGDAVTRKITREADDVSAMVFAPLESFNFAGVGVYEKEPVVADSFNRGDLAGKRIETITYMMERPGSYTLPELEFLWWDLKNAKLERVKLPGLKLEVEGSVETAAALPGQHRQGWLGWVGGCVFLLVVLGTCFYKRELIRSYSTIWKQRRQLSEKAYWGRIRKAVKAQDRRAVLLTTMQWLDILPSIEKPARLDLFFLRYGKRTGQFKPILPEDTSWSLNSFYDDLLNARKTYKLRTRAKKRAEEILPPLVTL